MRIVGFLVLWLTARVLCAGEVIKWDPRSMTLIQEGANYGRAVEVSPGRLICAYSRGGKLEIRRSRNGGRTWEAPIPVAEWEHGHLTNAELLPLKDGTLLFLFNRRPASAFGERKDGKIHPKEGVEQHPFSIGVTRSTNGGRTWSEPETLYEAGGEFFNGCWEPAGIQLPSGEIQVFFANEGPYRSSDEQEISMVRSMDGGKTWSAPETIAFRAGYRDGMPVPQVLRDNSGIAVTIEDNGLDGLFKPVIVFTSAQDNWKSGAVDGRSPNRWSALAQPLPASTYAGAPYLRQLRNGSTVLSFQLKQEGDPSERIAVSVGDRNARKFGKFTHPFPETPGQDQQWSSLCPLSDGTVLALADATIDGKRGLWCVRGKVALE